MHWTLKKFDELTTDEFHDIVQLRIDVFVVEQNCPYPELDGRDRDAYHFFGRSDSGKIVAYTRIFKAGDYYEQPSIGRVVVEVGFRREGIGYELMRRTLKQMEILFGRVEIKIGAQKYLRKFYENLGFQKVGSEYLEDGIPHVYMIRKADHV